MKMRQITYAFLSKRIKHHLVGYFSPPLILSKWKSKSAASPLNKWSLLSFLLLLLLLQLLHLLLSNLFIPLLNNKLVYELSLGCTFSILDKSFKVVQERKGVDIFFVPTGVVSGVAKPVRVVLLFRRNVSLSIQFSLLPFLKILPSLLCPNSVLLLE